ncbi:hypothetical protein BT96DRAFT_307089 [Gymnopus androsaceus JB14]|uniref:Uncharacterized protein n=1 Tax=Gymnopus androsaceus JB14 TaxID=1447944 RepID=A0A6A4I575_9AGAR|nr:hypothetical protein BT96DRAFT_307089 [Gymnopus androsaceus JB14]
MKRNFFTTLFKFSLAIVVFLHLFSSTNRVYALPSPSPEAYQIAARAAPAELRGRSYRLLQAKSTSSPPAAAASASDSSKHPASDTSSNYNLDQSTPLGRAERFQAVQKKRVQDASSASGSRRRRRDVEMVTGRDSTETLLSHSGPPPNAPPNPPPADPANAKASAGASSTTTTSHSESDSSALKSQSKTRKTGTPKKGQK